ncbi:MAG: hypothetical protein EAX86_04695 [Candidatus Heimdallarchaeota archaeon]|nr:hypothetical protein [Candidatus Heimdallarchaeota archaeon]
MDIYDSILIVFYPVFEGFEGLIINIFYIIGLTPVICLTAFGSSFISREKVTRQVVALLAFGFLLLSLIIIEIFTILVNIIIGDVFGIFESLSILFGILIFSIVPLAFLHIIIVGIFAILGFKIRVIISS